MIEFDASLFVLQEIYDLEVMGEIASYFPDSWRVTNAGKEHVFFYDTNEIELLSWETLSHLSKEPYTEYPGKDSSKPMMGMFRWAGIYSEPFCVISIHCKANDKTMQRAEGKWLLARVIELLDSGDVGREITVIGDTNGEPDNVPSTELVEGGVLYRLDNVNGEETDTRGRRVDHCYVTEDSHARIKDEKAAVFGPAYYGETRTEFRDTYSDHYPLLVDVECVQGGRLELFARFAHEWGSVECGVENGWCRGGDINADGEVGLEDLRMLFSQWVAGTP
jgi:endonuclease/exonuclease/phosphatase family metal-dependent hydrolase